MHITYTIFCWVNARAFKTEKSPVGGWAEMQAWAFIHILVRELVRLVPQYLVKTFSNVSDKNEHHTRAQTHQHLTLVKPKNNQLKRSFKYSGALNWNNLNPVIRYATSLNIFKSAYLKSHFNH